MNLYINLYIFSLNYQTQEYSLLLTKEGVPSLQLETNSIKNDICTLISNIFGTNSGWVKFQLFDVMPYEEDLVIVYSCLMPMFLETKVGKWENIGKIKDENTKQFVLQVLQKTIC